MSILDIAKQRFSVRNYLDKEISQETLETILEAAHVAPTAANMQPVKLLVVKSDEAKEKLAKAANIYSAPVAIIVCALGRNIIRRNTLSSILPRQKTDIISLFSQNKYFNRW